MILDQQVTVMKSTGVVYIVTDRSRSGMLLQKNWIRERPWLQSTLPEMVFQLLTQTFKTRSQQINCDK